MRRHVPVGRTHDSLRLGGWTSLVSLLATFGSPLLHAAPSGGEVTAGSGAISQSGTTVTIDQSSSRLAIDWQRFDIGAGESVTFVQPSAQAIALNRILGQDPSVILGNLSANGQVFLLNPNGVLFGAGAQVDVGGIVASTLSLSNDDFLAGRYVFAGEGSGGVVNRGTIDAGAYVAFVGPSVVNEGVIRANLGTVALGAGEQVTLNIAGDQLVGFSVDKAALGALAANRQLIQADGGTVILSAQAKDALASSVVNNDGIIEARSVSSRNGVIHLEGGDSGVVAVSGTLDASGVDAGESGGEITVTGDKVALLDGAHLDVSGSAGGGTALIGGGYQGGDPEIDNAARTFVSQSAEIHADALDAGDGGHVVVWANGDTRFHGAITAQGGSTGGNGGFVEVSGKAQLGFDGSVDTSAARGAIGTLLLDPNDLYIAAAPVPGALPDATNPFQSNDGVNDYYVLGSTLTALSANTAVQLQADRDIIFQTNLAMATTPAGSITLTAANGIQMGGFNLSTINAGVSMNAGAGGISNLGTIALQNGILSLNSTGAITQNAGDIIQSTGELVMLGSGTLTLSGANTYTGDTTVSAGTVVVTNATGLGTTARGTTVSSLGTLRLDNVAVGAEALTLNGGTLSAGTGTSSLAGAIALGANSTIDVTGTQLTLSGVTSGVGFGITKLGAGTLVLSAANTYTGATNVNAGTLRLGAANRIADASALTLAGGATFDLNNSAETVGSIAGAGSLTLGSATLTAGGNGTSTTFSGAVSGTGGLTKVGAGVLTLSGTNTYAGSTAINGGTLRASGGNAIGDASQVTLANTAGVSLDLTAAEAIGDLTGGGATGGNVTLNGNTLTVNQAGATTFAGVMSGTGGLTKQGAGSLTLSGTNTFTGPIDVNGGTLVLSGGAALADASVVNLGSGTLQVSTAETIGRLAGSSGTMLALAAGLTVGDAADTTIASTITGAGALTKRGTGSVTLTGTNTYSGATNVDVGTLIATNGAALGTTAAGTTVTNGAQLQIAGVNVGAEAVTLNGAGPNGLGSLVGTGSASLAGPVTLALSSTIGAPSSSDSLALNGTVDGAHALTQAGAGTVTFGSAVGGITALTSFASAAGSTTVINSGLLRTIDTQVYDGALVTGAATTLQTTNADVTANGPVTGAPGTLMFAAGTGNVSMVNPSNDLGTVAVTSAGAVNLVDANGLVFGSANVASLRAQTLAGDITLNGALDASGAGDAIVLASGGNFFNNAGASALTATNGRWLVWSTDPTTGNRGGLAYAFKQYDAHYGVTPVAGAGNGFLYSIAPAITPTLVGSVTRVYDGTTVASLLPSNYTLLGTIDGDVVTLNPGSSTFDDRNVGTGKNVSVSGLSIASATNGGALVYGYQLSSASANANIGTVTPAALTIAATTNAKTYDGTVTAAATPTVAGLVGGDTASGLTETYADANAGTGKTLSVDSFTINDGNGGGNYSVSLVDDLTGVIDPAALIGSILAGSRAYDGTTNATIIDRTLTGVIGGDAVSYVGGTATFADKNAGLGKAVTATGLGLTGADAGNYTVNTTATTTADIAALGITGVITAADKVYDGTATATIASRTLTGVIGSDDVAYVGGTATFDDRNAATGKMVDATGLGLSGADAGNYVVNTTASATASITPAALTIAATANAKTYDGTVTAAATPTVTGLVGGDTATGLSEAYADANAGTGKTLSVDSFTINDGNGGGNYNVALIDDLTGVIDPAALIGSILAGSRAYDATTNATITSRTLSGVIGADVVSYDGGSATFSDKNVGVGKTVTATGLSLGGADAGNYVVNTTATTTADIAALGITGVITAVDKVYDGTTTATIASRTLSGVIGGDVVSYVGGSATFADRNAGTGKTVSGSGLALAGTNASNYTVNATATAFADIDPRPITVTAAAGQTKIYGDADPLSLDYNVTSGNLVAGDGVSGALSRGAGENVGDYAITQNTLTAGSNYNLAFVSNPFAITPATLTYVATPVSVVRDASLPVFGGTVSGFKGSDTLISATSGTLLFATTADSSQIGAYAVDGSGLSANAGNYVFAQDPANATALIITPRVDPLPTDGALDALVGAIASALQAEGACAVSQDADVEVDGRALCNPRPDLRRTQQVENAAFARAGAGIRLPSGVSVQ